MVKYSRTMLAHDAFGAEDNDLLLAAGSDYTQKNIIHFDGRLMKVRKRERRSNYLATLSRESVNKIEPIDPDKLQGFARDLLETNAHELYTLLKTVSRATALQPLDHLPHTKNSLGCKLQDNRRTAADTVMLYETLRLSAKVPFGAVFSPFKNPFPEFAGTIRSRTLESTSPPGAKAGMKTLTIHMRANHTLMLKSLSPEQIQEWAGRLAKKLKEEQIQIRKESEVLSTNLIKRIYFVEKRIREGEKWQKQAPIIPEFIESSIKGEKGEAITKGIKLFQRIYDKRLKGLVWKTWTAYREAMELMAFYSAAIQIQKAVRGFLARRQALRITRGTLEKRLSLTLAKTQQSAIQIEKHWRGYHYGKLKVKGMKTKSLAASVLVRAWYGYKAKQSTINQILHHLEQVKMSIKIQSHYRGRIARRVVKKRKLQLRHIEIEERYSEYKMVVRTNFEMQGAAAKIQIWYLQSACRIMRLLHILLQRERAARKIQAQVRAFLARRNKSLAFLPPTRGKNLEARTDNYFGLAAPRVTINPKTRGTGNNQAVVGMMPAQKRDDESLCRNSAELIHSITSLQLWLRYMKKRRHAQSLCGALGATTRKRQVQTHKDLSVVHIQKLVRGFIQRRRTLQFRARCTGVAITIQKNIRRSIARSHYLRRRNSIIKERELTFAGRALYLLSLETEKKRQILTSSSNPDMMVAAELPRIFLYYTSANGTYTLNEESAEPLFVNLGRFIKFCNAVTGLLTKDFTARNAEHCFEQAKAGHKEKGLTYSQFYTAIRLMASQRYRKTLSYGKFYDDDAKFIKCCVELIFVAELMKRLIGRLEKNKLYPGRAKCYVLKALQTIQRWYRGSHCRFLLRQLQHLGLEKGKRDKTAGAAVLIQSAWRRYKAKIYVSKLAANFYEKCLHKENKQTYFYNPRTGKSYWNKPKLLRSRDVRNPIDIPDQLRSFIVKCSGCKVRVAKRYCLNCNEYQCLQDFLRTHKRGKAMNHTWFPADICAQCETQVASRHCTQCQDDFCDTCFYSLHKRGQLQIHSWRAITEMCNSCKKWMALRTCQSCGLSLCRCCANIFHEGLPGHEVIDYRYRPSSARKAEEEIEQKRKEHSKQRVYEERQAFLRERGRHLTAINIQKVWRGFAYRKPTRELLGEKADMQQRAIDNRLRRNPIYQLLLVVGFAPTLLSDGPIDRVLKKYPIWHHSAVKDAVDGDWIAALVMLKEQEAYTRGKTGKTLLGLHPNDSIRYSVYELSLFRLVLLQRLTGRLLRIAQEKQATAKTKEEKSQSKAKIKEVKARLADLDSHTASIQAKMECLRKVRDSQKGPDRLNRKIQEIRQCGRKLDVKVEVKQGLRSATFLCTLGTTKINEGDRYLLGLDPHSATSFIVKAIISRKPTTGAGKQEVFVSFDRDWVEESMEAFVYKIPAPRSYEKPFLRMSYKLQSSFLYQGPLKCVVVGNHLIAAFLTRLASKYDDDSPTSARLHVASRFFLSNKKKAMRSLFKFIEVNEKDYEVKAMLKGAQSLVIQLMGVIQKIIKATKKKEPYVLWEMSDDKKFVLILWRVLKEEEKEEMGQVIGQIHVDIDAPLSILREKIRRTLREPLNKKNGEGFIFVNDDRPLPRFYEITQRGRDIVQMRTNAETREIEYVLDLALDPQAEKVEIPFINCDSCLEDAKGQLSVCDSNLGGTSHIT